MPAQASGEIKTRIVHQAQKNGDTYVLERKTLYDPIKKYNRVLSSKIISKIPKGENTPVPTRPKRQKSEKNEISSEPSPIVRASRMKVGMMDIIDHIGKSSGIDDAVYGSTDIGTAQKILSLSRYLLASNGQSFPGITAWQYTHPLPYEDGISENTYHSLFDKIGRDEELQQSFFVSRCSEIKNRAVLAYDSTTISTYSENLPEARRGFSKTRDGLDTVKLLTLYSIETRQPIAFTKQPGNLPDVITIENALKQLQILNLDNAEIVTDNGYYSEKNLSQMLHAHFNFITLVKTGIKWVSKELAAHRDELKGISSACPFDTNTHGVTVMLMHDFSRTRKYASHKKDIQKGDEETFTRRIYLHLFFNPMRRVEQDCALDKDLFELKALLEEGKAVEELTDSAQDKVKSFLTVRRYGKKITVVFNEKAIEAKKNSHGYFTLVSNCEKDAFECLSKYRRRGTIESFFESGKQRADGTRTRVWSTDALRGRMFVQFVSLCYYEYLSNEIHRIKSNLAKENGEPGHDSKTNLALEKKLKLWLNNTPIYLMLQWFDTVEDVKVSTKLINKRWTTEITRRDQLLLDYLGLPRA